MAYDKPFLTYDQLIALMRSRNITINDESFAKKALSNMSYYTLVNGYKSSVLSMPGTDSFIPGTLFEELYTLHTLDVSIGNVILKYILYIERSLKSKMSYLVSKKYGVYTDPNNPLHDKHGDYLFRNNYSASHGKRSNTLRQLTEVMNPPSGSNKYQSKSLIHYRAHHNHIPPWILTTSITFGQIILWYSILKPADRLEICNSFLTGSTLSESDKKEFIKTSLDLLRDFRNDIAHGSRTILGRGKGSVPKNQVIALSQGIITSSDYSSNTYARSGLFAVFAIIMILLNDEYLIAAFVAEMSFILDPYVDVRIGGKTIYQLFNLPDDIIYRLNSFAI